LRSLELPLFDLPDMEDFELSISGTESLRGSLDMKGAFITCKFAVSARFTNGLLNTIGY